MARAVEGRDVPIHDAARERADEETSRGPASGAAGCSHRAGARAMRDGPAEECGAKPLRAAPRLAPEK